MIKIKDLFNKIRLLWISFISGIKNFFPGNAHKSSADEQCGNSGNDAVRDHDENTLELESEHEDVQYEVLGKLDDTDTHDTNTLESEHKDVWYDALEGLEDEDFDEQRNKEYEEGKYYSLQDALQEKTELDRSTQTLALAFEINKSILGSCNTDLSNLKLFAINKVDHGYALFLEDDQKNCVELHSKRLNMYFPPYFEKHSGKKTCAELFSQKENEITNNIIIPLQVPKNVTMFTKKNSFNPRGAIQSRIPDFPADVYLEDCEDDVNFYLNSNSSNIISLSIESLTVQALAFALGTPLKTEWQIKAILVQGGFANTFNNYLNPQPTEVKVNSGFEDLVNISTVKEPTTRI